MAAPESGCAVSIGGSTVTHTVTSTLSTLGRQAKGCSLTFSKIPPPSKTEPAPLWAGVAASQEAWGRPGACSWHLPTRSPRSTFFLTPQLQLDGPWATGSQSSPLPMDSPSPCRLSLLSLGFLFPIPIHYWANYCLSFKALLKCPLLPGASKSPWVWAGCAYSYAHCLFPAQGSSWKPGPCLRWSPSPSIPPPTRLRVGTPCRGMNENDNYIYQTLALESQSEREMFFTQLSNLD